MTGGRYPVRRGAGAVILQKAKRQYGGRYPARRGAGAIRYRGRYEWRVDARGKNGLLITLKNLSGQQSTSPGFGFPKA